MNISEFITEYKPIIKDSTKSDFIGTYIIEFPSEIEELKAQMYDKIWSIIYDLELKEFQLIPGLKGGLYTPYSVLGWVCTTESCLNNKIVVKI